ncbi:hypothetical protein PF005_g11584 [Phytophthora fragariae]|uniref:Uncharacterized protein n=1 Tax=Phytophthora fragariae TaxID=53985 RepID=A0A6A3EVA6_9STRA|nr:hypothetical protein PF003_g8066 [Phytophthora fragariae]KAE8937419.1 hypothetical protein PF009_g12674 [Phytophthora fragariae]KAE9009378.1 hypothetical protein PF011_g10298 [Phytophthora fragariae]KAE9107549.1 hypothetical protein PF010_g12226 [Phytophthora fragariae]KAE9110669.1 hypothetical protein PF007_g11778 [Phytophthora fragariae]
MARAKKNDVLRMYRGFLRVAKAMDEPGSDHHKKMIRRNFENGIDALDKDWQKGYMACQWNFLRRFQKASKRWKENAAARQEKLTNHLDSDKKQQQ